MKGALGEFAGTLSEMIEAKIEAAVERAVRKERGDQREHRLEGMFQSNTLSTTTYFMTASVPIHDIEDTGARDDEDFTFTTDPGVEADDGAEDPQTAHDLASEDDLYMQSESEHPEPPPSVPMDEMDQDDLETEAEDEVAEPKRVEQVFSKYMIQL